MIPSIQTPSQPPGSRILFWHRRVLGICLSIFALELGLFLVIFPWLRNWDVSAIPLRSPMVARFWMSPYFRGALSGLGLLNIYIGCAELFRHLREIFSRSS